MPSVAADTRQPSSPLAHFVTATDGFQAILETAQEHGIPSVSVGDIDVARNKPFGRDVFVLGSGLSAQVIRHVTDDQTKNVLPPNTTIALKVFHTSGADNHGATRKKTYETILREIKAFCHCSLLGHSNIVQLLYVGWRVDNPFPVLAMELGEHGSLEHLIRTPGPGMSTLQKQNVTIDIALGLYAIHQAGFAHGDLKPDNIIIFRHVNPTRQVLAKITDFSGSQHALDQVGRKPMHITHLWCAPEVLNEDLDTDWEKADIYSYGLIIGSIWARRDAGFGAGRLEVSSSSFLSAFLWTDMKVDDFNDFSWCLKSTGRVLPALKERLEEMKGDHGELLDVLKEALETNFWIRTDTNGLLRNLASLAIHLGRNIE